MGKVQVPPDTTFYPAPVVLIACWRGRSKIFRSDDLLRQVRVWRDR